ncbi:MAG: hypothetical protein M0Z89_10765 [Nitrospiraceae bacterium]|nr:hypothetical protein [Nitrospiraceae bacterium]
MISIEFAYDDVVMKQITKPRKGIYYPDLVIRLKRPESGTITFYIELDSGAKGKKYWTSKILSWNVPVLILVLHEQRLKIMKQYMIDSGRKQITGFSIVNRFLKDGLAGTQWHWLPDDKIAKCRFK